MSRLGRGDPVKPFAAHGFLGNTPANGTLPPLPVLVENLDDRRRKTPLLQPVIVTGAVAALTDSPPAPVSIDRSDQRVRYRPLDPVVVNGLLAVQPPATVTPPAPVVVPAGEDRRRRVVLPPVYTVGYDDVVPPLPTLVEPEERRRRRPSLDPVAATSDLLAAAAPPVAPSNITPPVVTGGQPEGSILSTTNGTWSGTPPITYTYQWTSNGNPILGATSSTYQTQLGDVGNNIGVTVTATNAAGNASAASNTILVTAAGVAGDTYFVMQVYDGDLNAALLAAIVSPTTDNWCTSTSF